MRTLNQSFNPIGNAFSKLKAILQKPLPELSRSYGIPCAKRCRASLPKMRKPLVATGHEP
jgi:hypothetical protein